MQADGGFRSSISSGHGSRLWPATANQLDASCAPLPCADATDGTKRHRSCTRSPGAWAMLRTALSPATACSRLSLSANSVMASQPPGRRSVLRLRDPASKVRSTCSWRGSDSGCSVTCHSRSQAAGVAKLVAACAGPIKPASPTDQAVISRRALVWRAWQVEVLGGMGWVAFRGSCPSVRRATQLSLRRFELTHRAGEPRLQDAGAWSNCASISPIF